MAQDVASVHCWSYDNTSATTSSHPGCLYAPTGFINDVWFRWTAPLSGDYRIRQEGINGVMGVFDGDDCATSMLVDCVDDSGMTDTIDLVGAVAGNAYLIVLSSWIAGAEGTGSICATHLGQNFCTSTVNSTGAAALIRMIDTASPSVSTNDFGLLANFVPVGEPGIFFYGPTALVAMPFGDGFRCVGGPPGTVTRIYPVSIGAPNGTMFTLLDNTNPAHCQITPGATLSFQCWFRDPAAGMSGFNLSDGLTVTFVP